MVYTVVLTGGIASGKTAVSDLFAALGTPIIDTDLIARQVVEPGQPAMARLIEAFGPDCLDDQGRLDRKLMRKRVFADASQRELLESILHPAIAEEVRHRVEALESGYCIVVIPLFTRSSAYGWADRVLVVDVDEETQLRRVMARDEISRFEAQSILDAQSSRADRLALADDVIVNLGTRDELAAKVRRLHHQYRTLAL